VIHPHGQTREAHQRHGGGGDRFGGEYPRERFRAYGVAYEVSEKTKSDIYKDLLPLINSEQVELLDDNVLINQLCSLERNPSRSGSETISPPKDRRDGVVNAHRHRDQDEYRGPARRLQLTLDLLGKVFLFRSCQGVEPGRRSGSPCLDYYIKRCEAPCVGYVSREDYRAGIDGVIAFLSGRYREIERSLERSMREASEDQRYEDAARERNRLRAV